MTLQAKLAIFAIFLCAALVLTQAVSSRPKAATVGAGTTLSASTVPTSYKAPVIESAASPTPPGPGGPRLVLLGCATMVFIALRRRRPSL